MHSPNPTLLPPANIVLGGSGSARTVTVTPTAVLTGTATITITVSDGTPFPNGALTAYDTFVLAVDANSPPEFTSVPVETAVIGLPCTYTITAHDADPEDALTITAPVSAPWLTLTQVTTRTTTLNGVPTVADDYPIVLQVTDGEGSDTQTFTITVPATNQAPVADAGDALTYRWRQIEGEPVVLLNNAVALSTTFTAPPSDAVLTFALVVTDALGLASAPDEVVVTVTLSEPDTLAWRGNVGAGVEYTLVFTATVGAGAGGTVVNTAFYRGDGAAILTASDDGFTVESGYDVYLPLVLKNY
ncbi:MAG: hypothetical protein GY832_44390 [Chloroflexi bacterium]|nr:hypothetical protein [Chloroflexota bacterium]